MRKVTVSGSISAALALAMVAPAQAQVLTFDDLGSETNYVPYGDTVSTGGFTFSNSLPLATSFIVWQNDSPDDADGPGYSLNVGYPDTVTTVSRNDGSKFDFLSIDLNHFTNNHVSGAGYQSPFDVTFTFFDDLGSSTSTVTVDALEGFQNFTFGKTGLNSLTFTTATNSIQLDNFKYAASATAAVPEPASWAMMIAGFGAIGGAMRRRKLAAASA